MFTAADSTVTPAVIVRPVLPKEPPPNVPPEQIGTIDVVVDEQGDVVRVKLISPGQSLSRAHARLGREDVEVPAGLQGRAAGPVHDAGPTHDLSTNQPGRGLVRLARLSTVVGCRQPDQTRLNVTNRQPANGQIP